MKAGKGAGRGTAGTSADPETGGTSWGFVVNASLVFLVVILAVSAASVMSLRASPAASADPLGDPAVPLTIKSVSVVQFGLGGRDIHVAATETVFAASFMPPASWHLSPSECLADVLSPIDAWGDQQWLGERAGTVATLAGDPSSERLYATGTDQSCRSGRFSSVNGGSTWSFGPMPEGVPADPSWVAFDPAHAGSLLAFSSGVLFVSADAGATWSGSRSDATPLGFDLAGRLVGWSPGNLLESLDEGSTWRRTGAGPAEIPSAAAVTATGTLVSGGTGLIWYPLSAAAPSVIGYGTVFSMAALTGGIVVLGADAAGHPWLATVADSQPGMTLATLPPELASLTITGGRVAANDSGAAIALSGPTTAIAFAGFVR
jgi:hypothetical protein